MVSEIDLKSVEPALPRVEWVYLHTCLGQAFQVRIGKPNASHLIVKHADDYTRLSTFNQALSELVSNLVVTKNEELEIDILSGLCDLCKQAFKKLFAVDQQVAIGGIAQRSIHDVSDLLDDRIL